MLFFPIKTMPIRVRKNDGKVYSLEELIRNGCKNSISATQIKVKKSYFAVNKNIRKDYAVLLENDSDFYISFSNSRIADYLSDYNGIYAGKITCYKKTLQGTYATTRLCKIIGEGIFELKKEKENLYRIIQPKK